MKKWLIAQALLLLVVFHSAGQKMDSVLNVLATDFPQEKMYIHYDKEYYVAGETIWFKAYFYSNGKPSGLSNNFYLQFTDSKGKMIVENRYPVMGAVAKGSIHIPDSLSQGNYYVRALTPNMLNAGESFVYKKNIFVFKPSSKKEAAAETQNVSLQFFPESGYLVDGITSTIGFKAVDQWGAAVQVKGVIKTEDGTIITSFSSYHDGMGRVSFTPQSGKKYVAETETPSGPRTYSLPEVKPEGITLLVQDEKGSKKIQLSRSEKSKAKYDNLLLLAEINNMVVFENEIAFDDYPSVVGHIITDSLPSGILHFTVFNRDGLPLAERLSFIDNGEYKSIPGIVPVKFSAEKRAANEWDINFPNSMLRSFSVSITDIPSFSFNDEDNIWSRLLLTSDLKGHINNPAWYFENQNDSTRLALDNLLLTQGWSRFNWTKILSGIFPEKKYTDRSLISITGKVTDEKSKEIFSGGKINFYVEAEDSSTQSYEAIVDTKGEFRIDSLNFYGKSKFFYAYTDAKEKPKACRVTILTSGEEKSLTTAPANMVDDGIQRNLLITQNKGEVDARYGYVQTGLDQVKELERVTLQSKSKKQPIDAVNEKYTSGVFRSPSKIDLDNINSPANDKSLNAVDYIKNSIQQIEIQGGQFVNRKNMSLMSGRKWLVGVFLNEAPSNIALLRTIRMQDVALIKFYEAGFVGVGSEFPGGAVAVYTKEAKPDERKPDKLSFFEYKGYAVTKEFYNPDYSTAVKNTAPDNRTTLYWNPDASTDQYNKSITVRFFNNDYSKKFRIVVEGFDADGKLVHLEKVVGN